MTGFALSLAPLAFVYWIYAVATGETEFLAMKAFFGSVVGLVLLMGWTFCLCYHLLNGIRHLFWDFGHGFDMESVNRSGYLVAINSAFLTVLIWMMYFTN